MRGVSRAVSSCDRARRCLCASASRRGDDASPTPKPGADERPRQRLTVSRVPSSRLGRLVHYGGTPVCSPAHADPGRARCLPRRWRGCRSGSAKRHGRRIGQSDGPERSERPATRQQALADARRGAQAGPVRLDPGCARRPIDPAEPADSHVLPPQIQEVFRRVQNMAHSMPFWQTQARHCRGQPG